MRLATSICCATALAAGVLAASPAFAGFLNGVTSHNGVDVIAVGDSGMVFRSVDGGAIVSKSYVGVVAHNAVAQYGLTLVIVGNGGRILRSTDSGLSWSTTIVAGTPRLLAVEMPTASAVFVAGENGTLLRSTDGGANFAPLTSGTSASIRNLRFLDASNGWMVGDGGFIRVTSDGGDTWNPVALVTPNHLYAVDQLGSRVWAVGANGTCWKSGNGGSTWAPVNLKIDSRSDVRAVTLQGADSVFIAGGGGFIRRSVDNGATWFFPQHSLLGEISDMHFVGDRGWVVSIRSPAPMRTADRGTTWAFAGNTTVSRSWVLKQAIQAGSNRGSAIALHPYQRNTIYCAIGSRFYVSRDDGETWTQFSMLPPGYTRVNAFLVSPKDTMSMVCTASAPQVLMRTDNGGLTWQVTRTDAFGEYGIPLEMHPDRPDTILFGPDNDVLYRSIDFGKTWNSYGSKIFRSPCDIIIVPESDSSAVLVGDGITGSGLGDLWRSTDDGVNFTKHYTTTGSEIPGMSMGRLDNTRGFATNWSVGGVERSTNTGLAWTQVQTTGSAWGTDVCEEDPNLVVYGVYSGGLGYLSLDGGVTYSSSSLPGSNYSFYARDRGCILAEQGGGMYKLSSTYAFAGNSFQAVSVTAANGGEVWNAGSTHDVTWSSSGIVMARVEYRVGPSDPWVEIGVTPGYLGRLSWTLPMVSTAEAMVRVSDAFDPSPSDESNANFTIALPMIASADDTLDVGPALVGGSSQDSILVTNSGTATLNITSIGTGTSYFEASPASLVLAPSASAYVVVTFTPDAPKIATDLLTLTSNAYNSPVLQVTLTGEGFDSPILLLATPDGGEVFMYGTSQKIAWDGILVPNVDLEYRVNAFAPWLPIAQGVPSMLGTYEWVIPDAPTNQAQVRVKQTGGGVEDISAGMFMIQVPRFHSLPYGVWDIGPVLMGEERMDTLRVTNPGSGTLTITNITVNRPNFVLGRTSMTLPPGGRDTLSVTYSPESTDRDTALITFTADDPATPHLVQVTGFGTLVTSVGDGRGAAFGIWQNRPNPFTGLTRIRYALPEAADVSLEVYNLQGQRVATLVSGRQTAGAHDVDFSARRTDGSSLPAGVYFYRFRAGAFAATRKMLLMQ